MKASRVTEMTAKELLARTQDSLFGALGLAIAAEERADVPTAVKVGFPALTRTWTRTVTLTQPNPNPNQPIKSPMVNRPALRTPDHPVYLRACAPARRLNTNTQYTHTRTRARTHARTHARALTHAHTRTNCTAL